MFSSEIGGQIAWLLPAALVLLGGGLWFTRRAPRTDLLRAGLVVWGGWLLVTGLTFSFMAGIFHAVLHRGARPGVARAGRHRAPCCCGSTGRRTPPRSRWPGTSPITAAIAFMLLDRTPDYVPWLKWSSWSSVSRRRCCSSASATCPRRAAVAVAAGRPGRPGWPAPRRTPSTPPRPRTPARSRPPAQQRRARAAQAARVERAPGGMRRPRLRRPDRTRGRRRARRWADARRSTGGLLQGSRSISRDHQAAGDRRHVLHLGRRRGRLEHRGRLPARHPAAGDGDRRLQRHGPEPDPGAVQAVRRRR